MGPDCTKCGGIGFTRWEAFVIGLANIVSRILQVLPLEPKPCSRCLGTGDDPDHEKSCMKNSSVV